MARALKEYPLVALRPEDLDGKIDFARVFGRSGPVHIEIGTGKAAFLLNQARAQPAINFLGIDFPDPWPKKRHHKRRFFNSANLDQLFRCLALGGSLRIATDHAEYFEQIQKLFTAESDRLEKTEFLPTAGADTGEWVGTNFERKYLKEDRPIFCLAVRKKDTIKVRKS
ncbi:MAG: tRNA (guanine(46)-N(7))-methyltransferase TrmB [Planctomycetota bacterium]|jgi:tRNA (guanine-N7-)-methyltransferase